jgi:hypothetical protein
VKRTLSPDASQNQAARATILAKRRKMSAAAFTLPARWRRVGFAGLDLATPCRSADAVAAAGCEVLQKSRTRVSMPWLA